MTEEIDREIEEKEPGFEKGMVSIEIFSSEKEEETMGRKWKTVA